ncbi:hypothetical protein Tco_0265029 [Tanacetum coccineum]
MVDDLLSTRIGYATRTALESYTKDFEKKAQEERKLYIDVVEKSVKDIIKDEVKSLPPYILPKEVSDFAIPVIQSTINESLENIILDKIKRGKSYKTAPEHKELYKGLVKSYNLDKDLFSSYGNVYSLKRDHDDKDKDEDPFAGSDRGSSKGTKSQPKSSGKSVQAEEPMFETADTEMPQDQGGDIEDQPNVEATPMDDWFKKPSKPLTPDRPAFNLLKGTCKSFVELEYHFEECYKGVTDQLDWNNPEGHEHPFDLSKPLPLIDAQGRQVVPGDYFFNNNLEYLKGGSSSRKYTTSTTKTKAAKYDNIEGIKDIVLELWSPVKKLSNLEQDVIFDLNVALRMFTRRIVILKRVEDLQLGVESYQKKLNITKPETFRFDISKLTSYTAYKNPQGIIYQDKFKRNRLMRSDELYKFCDGTLTSIRRVLHDIANNLRICTYEGGANGYVLAEIQNRRDLPRDIPLDSVEVLRYEKKSKVRLKGKVPTEMELVLEQTQQHTSYEVSVSTKGVKELKRKVKIKGEKKEALLTLRQKPALVMRMANAAAKPCQGDSLEFYLITGNPDGRSYWIKTSQANIICSNSTDIYKDNMNSNTLKFFKKDVLFKLSRPSMSMSVQKSQVHKTATRSQDDDKILCLVDDLKEAQVYMQVKPYGTSSSLKSKITASCSQDEVKRTSLRAQD